MILIKVSNLMAPIKNLIKLPGAIVQEGLSLIFVEVIKLTGLFSSIRFDCFSLMQ